MKKVFIAFVLLILVGSFLAADYDFSKIKNSVSEFTLPNGLKFILVEDHSVPIASFVTYANVGASDERIGIYGISHFLEHMAFKGTSEVGTSDHVAEKKVFAELDAMFDKMMAEKNSINPDKEKIKVYEEEFAKLKDKASKYIIPNEFDRILEKNGVKDENAGTSWDSTVYFFSLPSNRLELWAYMESSRFSDPVFREFHKERGVIQEERRVRVENMPIGKMIEEFLGVAYKDHPYGVNAIGPMNNIDNITRRDMYQYFRTNYNAGNLVVGVYGDVTPDQLHKVAEKYFSKIPKGNRNPLIYTRESKQAGEKTVTLYEDSQPVTAIGYHIPSVRHEDFVKFSVLDNILTRGRSSRLKKKLSIDKKIAMELFSMAGFPGNKYSTLYLIFGIPNSKHTNDELLAGIDAELQLLKKELVTPEELDSAKTRVKITTLRGMENGLGLVQQLLTAEVKQGSWKKAFDQIAEVENVTAEDIQKIAQTYFIKTNRSIVRIEKKEKEVTK